jgi:hypothetical protein
VTDKKKEFQARWDRMDKTRDRIQMKAYTLKGKSGKWKDREIPGVISVTMNSAAVYANTVASALMGGKWQTNIEGKIPASRTHTVETFIDNVLADADERLNRRMIPSLFQWLCNHVTVRGFIGCRFLWLTDEETKEIYPDVLPLDMRYAVFETDTKGLVWGANLTRRSAAEILSQYNIESKAKTAEVTDYWDREKEEVWIDGKMVYTENNMLGLVPFVVGAVPSGFMLRDEGYMEYESPDSLFLNEGLYDIENMNMSIEQTLSMKLILPPYQKKYKDAITGEPAKYPDQVGAVNEVLDGEEYELLQTQDINRAHQMGTGSIQKALGNGGLTDIDLGSWLASPPPSGAAITAQSEIRAKVLEPRLQTLADFKSALARMILSQWFLGGYKGDIGKSGNKLYYSTKEIGDPSEYNISYRLMSRSKVQEVANLAMAQAAQGIYSRESILRNIIMTDDPEGEIAKLDAEKAEQADPALFYLRKALACADAAVDMTGEDRKAKELESKLLTQQGVNIIRQRNQPVETAPAAPGQATGASQAGNGSLVSLLGQRGLNAGRQPQLPQGVK